MSQVGKEGWAWGAQGWDELKLQGMGHIRMKRFLHWKGNNGAAKTAAESSQDSETSGLPTLETLL